MRLAGWIDGLNEAIGRAVSWLTLAMALLAFGVAVARYAFAYGDVALQEAYVWMNGVLFTTAAAFALKRDAHVRVDVFYRPASARAKAVVDALGTLFLLLPTVATVFWLALPYVWQSVQRLEGSREAGGLPGVFALKGFILVFCALMALQGLSMLLRSTATLLAPRSDRERA